MQQLDHASAATTEVVVHTGWACPTATLMVSLLRWAQELSTGKRKPVAKVIRSLSS